MRPIFTLNQRVFESEFHIFGKWLNSDVSCLFLLNALRHSRPHLLLHDLNEISAGIVKDGHDDVLPLCRLQRKSHAECT